jgi:hypothetical protein
MASQPKSFANPKKLKFVFTLAIGLPNRFLAGGSQQFLTLTIQGLRASVHVDNGGGNMMPQLQAQIYGMTASDMNAVTTINWATQGIAALANVLPNIVAVYAVEGPGQEVLVFSGNIVNAWGIYTGMPDVFLTVEARGFYFAQLTPSQRTTIKTNTDIATVMEQLANNLGMIFENNGVTGTVRAGQTLSGSWLDQANQMADAYRDRFTLYRDTSTASLSTIGTLAITPPNVARPGGTPVVNPRSGLIGYPAFNGYGGILFDTYFNPAIKFGGQVEIQSAIPKASGKAYVSSLSHDLESQTPGGRWRSTVTAYSTQGAAALAAAGG